MILKGYNWNTILKKTYPNVTPDTNSVRKLVWFRAGLDTFQKRKIYCPFQKRYPHFSFILSSHHNAYRNTPYLYRRDDISEFQSRQRISDLKSSFTNKANSQTKEHLQIRHFCSLPNPHLHITDHTSLINDKGHFHDSCFDDIRLWPWRRFT
jgi:hypothetical protein